MREIRVQRVITVQEGPMYQHSMIPNLDIIRRKVLSSRSHVREGLINLLTDHPIVWIVHRVITVTPQELLHQSSVRKVIIVRYDLNIRLHAIAAHT